MVQRPDVPCRSMPYDDAVPTPSGNSCSVMNGSIDGLGMRLEESIQRLEQRIEDLANVIRGQPHRSASMRSTWAKGLNHNVRFSRSGIDNFEDSGDQDVRQAAREDRIGTSIVYSSGGTHASLTCPTNEVGSRHKTDERPMVCGDSTDSVCWRQRAITSLRTITGNSASLPVEDLYNKTLVSKHTEKNLLAKIIKSVYFDTFISIVVLFNAVMLGVQVNAEAASSSSTMTFSYIEWTCTGIFTAELALRMWAVGLRRLCCGADRLMTLLDVALVLLGILEVTVDVLSTAVSEVESAFMVRLLKVLRIGRLLRPLRTVALLGELRVIATMIVSSFRSMFWLLCILVSLTYCFALILTQGATTYLNDISQSDALPDQYEDISHTYGSVPRTMYALFLGMTGGRNWGEIAALIGHAGLFYGGMVNLYIFINLFSVLNIVTGVFVDGAIELGKRDRNMMIQKQNGIREASKKHLVALLSHVDSDGDGIVSKEEFFTALQEGEVTDFMDALGIDPDNATEVFMLLDSNEDGIVNLQEFIQGMDRIRGEAKSIDIQMLLLHTRKIIDSINRMQGIQSKLLTRMPTQRSKIPKKENWWEGRWDQNPARTSVDRLPGLSGVNRQTI